MAHAPDRDVGEERRSYYDRIAPLGLAPLWETLHALVPKQPATPLLPVKWDYDNQIREKLLDAGRLISAEEAERRVLILENPAMRGQASITQSLYAGLQLILPGEKAPPHRHSQSALRFVIEGSGAYTTVDGDRAVMQPGDFVITPSRRWHEHGNETDVPMVWLDGLDIPLVRFLGAGFAQGADRPVQVEERSAGDNFNRFGRNLAPVDWEAKSPSSPLFSYPYAHSRTVLETMALNDRLDPCHGHKLRYVNPASGGWPIPTIGAFIQLLPKGFESAPYRGTDSTVFVAVEGEGRSIVGDTMFQWKPRDIFVLPSWTRVTHRAESEAVLFSFSDRPVQQALGLWREQRGDEECDWI
jgi:gentisate 1,2-dioxygenase